MSDTRLVQVLRPLLDDLRQKGLFKRERRLQSAQGADVTVNGQHALNFCANNYLGFANHPEILAAASDALDRYEVSVRDAYDGIDESGFDRMVLDLPEPWRLVKPAEEALLPGGILVSYLPTIGQVSALRDSLARSAFGMAETVEVLQRSWHVEGQSVRPDHRMVAHTGFLTSARLLGSGGEDA